MRHGGEIKMVNGSLKSCIRRDAENNIILPFPFKIRSQGDIHGGSCVHHALCSTLEILQCKKMKRKGLTNVDVGFLIRKYRPPGRIESMLKNIISVKDGGLIRAEDMEYPYKIVNYVKYDIKRGKKKALDRFIVDFLEGENPGVGCFGFSESNKPTSGKIFVRKADKAGKAISDMVKCKVCDKEYPRRHAVCVTGTARGIYPDMVERHLIEYVDSERPKEVLYMTGSSLDCIFVPRLAD